MKKAAIEMSSRTILLLIIFIVLVVIFVMISINFADAGNNSLSSMQTTAELFCPTGACP